MASDYKQNQKTDFNRFKEDTQNHVMKIVQDDGLFRHIRVAQPNSNYYAFNITTFPNYMVYTGDCGSFVFSRLIDMFQFHRINWDKEIPTIDYCYWSSKCEAVDKCDGIYDFDEHSFKYAARKFFKNYMVDIKNWRHHYRDFKENVIESGVNTSNEAISLVYNWSYYDTDISEIVQPFTDFWDYQSFTKPSFRLKWACWAIADTIRKYDEFKKENTNENS